MKWLIPDASTLFCRNLRVLSNSNLYFQADIAVDLALVVVVCFPLEEALETVEVDLVPAGDHVPVLAGEEDPVLVVQVPGVVKVDGEVRLDGAA